jgi:hypothetical protein
MDENVLEEMYQEKLAERLIEYLSEKCGLDYQKAMDVYYKSKLADKIYEGKYGVQYLDYKVLADILIDTEPELFTAKGEEV